MHTSSDEKPAEGHHSETERLRRGLLRIAREVATTTGILPGEFELARILQSSRPHVRRVLASLEHAGVVKRHQGAATTVDPTALHMTVRLEEQLDHSELLTRLGYEPRVEVLTSELAPLPAAIARDLTVDAGAVAYHGIKRWRADGIVAMIGDGYVALPAEHELQPEGAESVFAIAEQLWGEPVVWEIVTPGVITLDEDGAREFELPVGTACLTLHVVGVTRSGRRVFSAFERHHPDIVKYSLVRSLQPPWGNGTPFRS